MDTMREKKDMLAKEEKEDWRGGADWWWWCGVKKNQTKSRGASAAEESFRAWLHRGTLI